MYIVPVLSNHNRDMIEEGQTNASQGGYEALHEPVLSGLGSKAVIVTMSFMLMAKAHLIKKKQLSIHVWSMATS